MKAPGDVSVSRLSLGQVVMQSVMVRAWLAMGCPSWSRGVRDHWEPLRGWLVSSVLVQMTVPWMRALVTCPRSRVGGPSRYHRGAEPSRVLVSVSVDTW